MKNLGYPKNFTLGVQEESALQKLQVLDHFEQFWTIRTQNGPEESMIFQNGPNGHDQQKTEILERYFFLGQPAVSRLNTFPRFSNTLALKKFPKKGT